MSVKKDKICNDCNIELLEYNWIFHSDKYKKKTYICDVCRKKKSKEYITNNKKEISITKKNYRFKLRLDIINYYGGKCQICGENDIYYLTIDHINNDGNIDRKVKKLGSGHNFYRYLIKNNFPEGFRVLCFNCNCSTSTMKDHINSDPDYQKYKNKLKETIIKEYGGKCQFCFHNEPNHLTIDHIDGVKEEDKENRSSLKLYKYLRDNNFPKDRFQLLCYNCNCAKGFFGYIKRAKNE